MDKILPLLQRPRTIHLLLRPRFEGSVGVQGLPAVGTRGFLPLRWVSLPMQWWPVALKNPRVWSPTQAKSRRGKQAGSFPRSTTRSEGSSCPSNTEERWGKRHANQGCCFHYFCRLEEEQGGTGFQWQLRGAQGPKSGTEGTGEGGEEGTGKQQSHCRHRHVSPSHLSSNLALAQGSFCPIIIY